MKISSFDIFDTCLVRKCGTPENFFDVFSLRAFEHEPPEWARQEFVAARRLTEQKLWAENPHYTLEDIWAEMDWSHPFLKSKKELCELEQELEREMLVSVLTMRDKVNECRKSGDKIIFISDMYLSAAFLIDVMRAHGFYQEGDALYVSCECHAAKYNGELFRYVKEKEGLSSFRHWHHYGDNKQGDYKAPKKLGIKCTLINHAYTPYQQQWIDNDYSLGFKYPSILAGLGRALHYCTEWNTHTDFVLDIIAPFYCSLVCRMMRDAEQRGIKRLYFCARDAWPLYCIAGKLKNQFPQVGVQYLYVSRKSLYEGEDKAKIAYFERIGLATMADKVAIVDVRSQGKTQRFLSDFLMNKGYKEVFGYYFEMYTLKEMRYFNPYYCEANHAYLSYHAGMVGLLPNWQLYEDYFSMNNFPKTIDYAFDENHVSQPVFTREDDNENSWQKNAEYWQKEHETLTLKYLDSLIQLGLMKYVDEIFEHIAMPTLTQFFVYPHKHYLSALTQFYAYNGTFKKYSSYVDQVSWLKLIFTNGRSGIWRRATFIYNLPNWLARILFVFHKK